MLIAGKNKAMQHAWTFLSYDDPTKSDADIVHRGGCFCKAVGYKVVGLPLLSAYCHCTLCQGLNAATFVLTVHFPSSRFSWTHSEPYDDMLESYSVSIIPWKHVGVARNAVAPLPRIIENLINGVYGEPNLNGMGREELLAGIP